MFSLPRTYAYATIRKSVAGSSTFRGNVSCISNFVTTRQIKTPYSSPYLSPYGSPNDVPVGQKVSITKKSLGKNCTNSFLAHMLSHDRWLLFFWGCLRVPTRRCNLVVPAPLCFQNVGRLLSEYVDRKKGNVFFMLTSS